jgi:rhodanese-related sulfurtransferase
MPLHAVTFADLIRSFASPKAPLIFDVRREKPFGESARVIAGARWRSHLDVETWGRLLPKDRAVVVYCVHGHQVSQTACAVLRRLGIDAHFLEGGFEDFVAAGGPTLLKAALPKPWPAAPTRWVTRERPKIDRIACPWLIRRFIDPDAHIYYVAADQVVPVAKELDAIPYDVKDVEFTHRGELCSFDTFLDIFGIDDPPLRHVARIVRGADTARLDLEPECAGLAAFSFGLSAAHEDDHKALEIGSTMYDALYVWARDARSETHNWPAKAA